MLLQFISASLMLALGATAATFTILDVDNGTPHPSIISVRPIGIGSDGATTYEIAEALPTGGFNANNGQTSSIGSTITLRGTLVADAFGNSATAAPQEGSPFSQQVICSWGTQKEGVCVGVFAEDKPDNPAEETVTFSGSVFPLFTVTVDDPSALSNAQPTQSPGGAGLASSASPTTSTAPASAQPSNGAELTLSGSHIYLGVVAVLSLYWFF